MGLNLPVIAIDTLMAVAESARRQQPAIAQALASGAGPLWVLQDARMSEAYAAAYTDAVRTVMFSTGALTLLAAPIAWLAIGRRDPLLTVWQHQDERETGPAAVNR